MSNFMPAAWQIRRAKIAQEQWNNEHPDRLVPWEWVEEMLLAWRSWKEQGSYAPGEATEAYLRYQEFARKIPVTLEDEIFSRTPPKQKNLGTDDGGQEVPA